MRMRPWTLALAPLLLVGGCAGSRHATIDAATVARLPEPMRQSLNNEEQAVTVAEANLQAAQRSLEEARDFRTLVGSQLSVAQSHLTAAEQQRLLGPEGHNQVQVRAAEQAAEQAERQVSTLQAKQDYADRLLALRQARFDEAQAGLEAARANYKVAALNALTKEGAANQIDRRRILDEKSTADRQLADARMRAAQFEGFTAQARAHWDQLRRASQSASRGTTVLPPTAPPELLTPPSLSAPSAPPPGGVNQGPSAPESVPLPTPNQLP